MECKDKETTLVSSIPEEFIAKLYEQNPNDCLPACQEIRIILCNKLVPPIYKLEQLEKIVPRLTEFLNAPNHELQRESLWILGEIASGSTEQTSILLQTGTLPVLIEILERTHYCDNDDLKKGALEALINIARDSFVMKDSLLKNGILTALQSLLSKTTQISIIQDVAWITRLLWTNVVKYPIFEYTNPSLVLLQQLIKHPDREIHLYVCSTICHMTGCEDEDHHLKFSAVVSADLCPYLVQLLKSSDFDIIEASLKAIMNVTSAYHSEAQVFINCSILPILQQLLCQSEQSIWYYVCSIIYNIVIGPCYMIQAVINAKIFPALNEVLDQAFDRATLKEVSNIITHVSSHGSPRQRQYLSSACIPKLCKTILSKRFVGDIKESIKITPDMINDLYSDNINEILNSARKFKKILCEVPNVPIDEVIQLGIVPKIADFLKIPNYKLQFEAAWVLTNIASGNSAQVQEVVRTGAIPQLVSLLKSKNKEVQEQTLWALSNIAGDSFESRNLILAEGILPLLYKILCKETSDSLLRIATWSLSNLSRGKCIPDIYRNVAPWIQVFKNLLQHTDKEILSNVCWIIHYFLSQFDACIQTILDVGIHERLVELMRTSQHEEVIIAALSGVSDVVSGTDLQTQVILDCGVLPILSKLIYHNTETIKKEVCFALSNITAGNAQQIQSMIEAKMFSMLFDVLFDGETKTRKEAEIAITNVAGRGTQAQYHFITVSCIPKFHQVISHLKARFDKITFKELKRIIKEVFLHCNKVNIKRREEHVPIISCKCTWLQDCPLYFFFQKLQAAGYDLSEYPPSYLYGPELSAEVFTCGSELDVLKSLAISTYPRRTAYDFLRMKRNAFTRFSGNEILAEIYDRNKGDFTKDFPNYGFLLNMKYSMGRSRRSLLESAKNSLEFMIGQRLPESCSEKIFASFGDEKLQDFVC